MQKVRVTSTVTIHSGTLGLSDKQASKRTRMLKKLKGSKYDVLEPVQFKAGEQFEIEEIDKAQAHQFEVVQGEAPQKDE